MRKAHVFSATISRREIANKILYAPKIDNHSLVAEYLDMNKVEQ